MSKVAKTKSAAMRSFHITPRSTPKGILKARKSIFGPHKVQAVKLPKGAPYPVAGVTERTGTTLLQANALALAAQLEKELGGNEALIFFRKIRQNSELRTGDHVSQKGCKCNHKQPTGDSIMDRLHKEEEAPDSLEKLRDVMLAAQERDARKELEDLHQRHKVMLPDCFDAQVWAKEWLKTIKDNPGIPTDEGTMISWFANALMAGHNNARRKYDRPQEVPVRDNILPLPQECRKAEANDCKKSSPMLEASDIVFKLLALVDDEVTFLGSKLQPVLGPEGPQSTGDAKCESACNSGLTETLRNYQRRLEMIRQNMRNLRERVEV